MKHAQKGVRRAVKEGGKRAATDEEKATNESESSDTQPGPDGGGAPIPSPVISYLPTWVFFTKNTLAR